MGNYMQTKSEHMLLENLKSEAIDRGLLNPDDEIDAAMAFQLVRDMPYARASSRDPQTIIKEWRGTCSGKHYLLKDLFEELGHFSRLIASTTVEQLDPKEFWGELGKLLKQSNGRFVDVHNYLILELPDREMIVDATWPISTKGLGTVVNERFELGKNHKIAVDPIKSWVVPEDCDPQEFKAEILRESFTSEELAHREEFIMTLSRMSNSKLIRLLVRLERFLKGEKSS
jgi:hypothetical protein